MHIPSLQFKISISSPDGCGHPVFYSQSHLMLLSRVWRYGRSGTISTQNAALSSRSLFPNAIQSSFDFALKEANKGIVRLFHLQPHWSSFRGWRRICSNQAVRGTMRRWRTTPGRASTMFNRRLWKPSSVRNRRVALLYVLVWCWRASSSCYLPYMGAFSLCLDVRRFWSRIMEQCLYHTWWRLLHCLRLWLLLYGVYFSVGL